MLHLISCLLCLAFSIIIWCGIAAPADAETITLQASYRNLENAKECQAAVVKRVTLQGPGEVTIHIKLNPYRSAGYADNFPVRYGEYKNGRFQGWAFWAPFEHSLGGQTIQGGTVVKGRDPAEGVPVERISKYKMNARTYEFDVRLSPPCRGQGSAGFQQWAQNSEVVITATQASQKAPPSDSTPDKTSKGPLFEKPMYNNKRLDWCREWAKDCGKGAADVFCSLKGYSHAESWDMDADIGHLTPTIVIGTGQTCSERHCDGFKYIKCAGTASAVPPPNCVWDSFTNDQRQFATQPGGVLPLRRSYAPGSYLVHVGPAGKSGLDVPPRTWKTFGPYSLVAGSKYAAIPYGMPIGLNWEKDSARLTMYSAPQGHAVVYARNEILDQFYAICLEPVKGGAALPSLAGKWAGYRGGRKVADCSIRQDGTNLTFIIHRTPEQRSPGRFITDQQVVAEAPDWGNKGAVSTDGRRIDWDNNSYWIRVD